MFKGRVENISHEGGLLVSYSGACPALGSVMVDTNHQYIGKVDAVIGNLKKSFVHVAHLDRNSKPKEMIGLEIVIRTKKAGQVHRNDRRNDRRNERRSDHRDGRGNDRRNNRRGDRRDDRRNNSDNFGRNRYERSGKNDNRNGNNNSGNHSKNDWKCGECQNINFSFRTECNRCGAKKGSRGKPGRKWQGNDRRSGDRKQDSSPRPGDWECPQCGKSNFARRTDCFSCGRQKRVGGPRIRGHHRKLKDPPPIHPTKYGRSKRRGDR